MNLKYRVLWFEDDPDIVNEYIGVEIKEYLYNLGFEPTIIHEKNGQRLDTLIKDKNYDLIVSDLNLGEYETGDKLVEYIRSQSVLTEVLLYSANVADINGIIDRKGVIERISFAVGIKNVPDKLRNIIMLTVKKVQDVNNMRGLVIAQTIDLEMKIEEIVMKYFEVQDGEALNENKRKMFINICDKKVNQCNRDVERVKGIHSQCIQDLIEQDILTANNVYEAIQSILNEDIKNVNRVLNGNVTKEEREIHCERKKQLNSFKVELNNFFDEIIKVRNTLAHVQEKINDEGIPYLESINKSGTTIVFDEDRYAEIRNNLRKHTENLLRIQNYCYTSKVSSEKVAAIRE